MVARQKKHTCYHQLTKTCFSFPTKHSSGAKLLCNNLVVPCETCKCSWNETCHKCVYIDLWVITLVTNSEDHLVTFAMNNQNLVYWANSRKISVALAQVPSSMDECLPDCKPTQSSAWRTHPSAPWCWRCQRYCMTCCRRQIIYLEWTLCAQLPESRRGWNSKELFLLALLPRQTSNDSCSYW